MSESLNSAFESGNNHVTASFSAVGNDVEQTRYPTESHVPLKSTIGNRAEGVDEDYYERKPKSNYIQRITVCLVFFVVAGIIVLIGLAASIQSQVSKYLPVNTVTTVYPSLGLPQYQGYSWNDIEKQSYGQSVRFGIAGSPKLQRWVKTWLAPELQMLYGINMEIVSLTSTSAAVAALQQQRAAGNLTDGPLDLIFINGLNFYNARAEGNLYGPWVCKVPSYANFDFSEPNIAYDHGQPTNCYEMPVNGFQFVLTYNISAYMSSNMPTAPSGVTYKLSTTGNIPPQSMTELLAWAKANPGKFTYPNPYLDRNDVGGVFLRNMLYEFGGTDGIVTDFTNYKTLLGPYNPTLYAEQAPRVFRQLQALAPYVYKNATSGQPYYPFTYTVLNTMLQHNEVIMTMAFDSFNAASNIIPQGQAKPAIIQSFVPLEIGTIANVAFAAIPFNSPNILAALVAGNYIGSIQAQFNRREPVCLSTQGCAWQQQYSASCDELVNNGWSVAFDYLHSQDYPSTPPFASLRDPYSLPEVDGNYGANLVKDWEDCVFKNYTATRATSGTLCH